MKNIEKHDQINIKVNTIDELHSLSNLFGNQWYFRGLSSIDHNLSSTYERANKFVFTLLSNIDFDDTVPNLSYDEFAIDDEVRMIKRFAQRANNYYDNSHNYKKLIDWYSLFRHFEGPSRMVDFTRSFYIGLFFALHKTDKNSCIWCINGLELMYKKEKRMLGLSPIDFIEKKMNEKKGFDFIVPFEPSIMNERMAIQQGIILFPGSFEFFFNDILYHSLNINPKRSEIITIDIKNIDKNDINKSKLIHVEIDRKLKSEIIAFLTKVNITHETMFPGLDGYCRSQYFPYFRGDESFRNLMEDVPLFKKLVELSSERMEPKKVRKLLTDNNEYKNYLNSKEIKELLKRYHEPTKGNPVIYEKEKDYDSVIDQSVIPKQHGVYMLLKGSDVFLDNILYIGKSGTMHKDGKMGKQTLKVR